MANSYLSGLSPKLKEQMVFAMLFLQSLKTSERTFVEKMTSDLPAIKIDSNFKVSKIEALKRPKVA